MVVEKTKKIEKNLDVVCRENHKRFKISANFDFCLFLSFQKKKFISVQNFFLFRSKEDFFSIWAEHYFFFSRLFRGCREFHLQTCD